MNSGDNGGGGNGSSACQRGGSGAVFIRAEGLDVDFTSGAGEFTIPANVFEVEITAIGAGGGGGNRYGGEPGKLKISRMKVKPGDRISYQIGSGGGPHEAGGDTIVKIIE